MDALGKRFSKCDLRTPLRSLDPPQNHFPSNAKTLFAFFTFVLSWVYYGLWKIPLCKHKYLYTHRKQVYDFTIEISDK